MVRASRPQGADGGLSLGETRGEGWRDEVTNLDLAERAAEDACVAIADADTNAKGAAKRE